MTEIKEEFNYHLAKAAGAQQARKASDDRTGSAEALQGSQWLLPRLSISKSKLNSKEQIDKLTAIA